MRSQPPPAASTGPASKPKVGCSGSSRHCFSDARACACRSSSPHEPGKSKIAFRSPSSAPPISKNDPGPFGFASGRRRGRRRSWAPAPPGTRSPRCSSSRRSATAPPARAGRGSRSCRAISVRSFTFASRWGTSRTTVPSGSTICSPSTAIGRRLVGDEVGQRAQAPGDAADVHLALVLGQRALDQPSQPRPLQHDRGGEHREHERPQPAPMTVNRTTRSEARSRQRAIIVARTSRAVGDARDACYTQRRAARFSDSPGRSATAAAHAMLTMRRHSRRRSPASTSSTP